MYSVSLRHADHVRHYAVHARHSGWEVVCEEDRALKRCQHYDDWHRLERALDTVRREVHSLTAQGWQVER